jgi:hypothetical protein
MHEGGGFKMARQPLVEYDFKHNGERLLHMLRQRHPEYHPILSIANIAHVAEQEEGLIDTALRAHAIILKYVEPELKSVEVNINQDRKRVINVSLFEEVQPELLGNGSDTGHQEVVGHQEAVNQIFDVEIVEAVNG